MSIKRNRWLVVSVLVVAVGAFLALSVLPFLTAAGDRAPTDLTHFTHPSPPNPAQPAKSLQTRCRILHRNVSHVALRFAAIGEWVVTGNHDRCCLLIQ